MGKLTIDSRKRKKSNAVISQYDVAADVKNRISLRGVQSKYFHVRAFSNGCYILEPRVLVKPLGLSERSLKMIDQSVTHLLKGKSSTPIDLSPFI
ncbi:MAG: hypothetical protein K2W99_06435 [Chthoniobacterales bacterium]|nr:hypothetical protein [Chthoniobacterales bacterium]